MKNKAIQNYNNNEKQYIINSLLLFDNNDTNKRKNTTNIHNYNNPDSKIAIKNEEKKEVFIIDEKYNIKDNDKVFVIQPYPIKEVYDKEIYIQNIKSLNNHIENIINFNNQEVLNYKTSNSQEKISYEYIVEEVISYKETTKGNNTSINTPIFLNNIDEIKYFISESEVVWEVYSGEESPIAYMFFQIETYIKEYKPQNEYVKKISTMIYAPYNKKKNNNNYWEQKYKREKTSFEYFKQESINMALLLLNIFALQDNNKR